MNPPTDRERPALSEDDWALIERELGGKILRDGFKQHGARFYPENIARLLAAARAETSPKPALSEALDVFMLLGRPQGTMPAFCDMHPDDIILKHSGVLVTVGDVRLLQDYLRAAGVAPKDRLTQLMKALPEGSRQ